MTDNSTGGVIRFNKAGQILHASVYGQVNYFTIDPAAGTLMPISGSAAAMPNLVVAAASLDPTGQFLYVAGQAASISNSNTPSGNLIYASPERRSLSIETSVDEGATLDEASRPFPIGSGPDASASIRGSGRELRAPRGGIQESSSRSHCVVASAHGVRFGLFAFHLEVLGCIASPVVRVFYSIPVAAGLQHQQGEW
jgi:hypothetical protein